MTKFEDFQQFKLNSRTFVLGNHHYFTSLAIGIIGKSSCSSANALNIIYLWAWLSPFEYQKNPPLCVGVSIGVMIPCLFFLISVAAGTSSFLASLDRISFTMSKLSTRASTRFTPGSSIRAIRAGTITSLSALLAGFDRVNFAVSKLCRNLKSAWSLYVETNNIIYKTLQKEGYKRNLTTSSNALVRRAISLQSVVL